MHVFTLEIDGRPSLVFDAASIDDAKGICALAEFRADLGGLTSHGTPLCSDAATFAVRDAVASEIVSFNHALLRAEAADGPTFAFLIPVDGMMVTVIASDQ